MQVPKSVELRSYGGVDVLKIIERPKPDPKPGRVIVKVIAAGTNPGEIAIREGHLKEMFPMAFPFGQGTDYAGVVDAIAQDVGDFHVGDEVLGWVENRSSQAEYVVADPEKLIPKPPSLDWYRAGSLFVAGTTAVAAVDAVELKAGDVVAISGAAGGVGSLAVQLAARTGARVIGIASGANAEFLRSVGVESVPYGDGLEERLRMAAPGGIDAWIDLFGNGYVDLAIEIGVKPDRIDTIIDFAAVGKYGVNADGSAQAGDRKTLAHLADRIAWGELSFPIAAIYPFTLLHDAYRKLALRKTHGKIVLSMDPRMTRALVPSASNRTPGT
jgi:NADPH:quinone reductase-like Zn-dependent oxidoreductase